MSLAEFEPQRVTVSFGREPRKFELSLRGLALDDVTIIIRENLAGLDDVLQVYADNVNDKVAVAATAQYALELVKGSPALVARIIALAADESHLESKAARLPIPVQVDCIKAIIELTFSEAGGVKNFVESLTNLMGAIRPVPAQTGLNT